MGPLDGGRGDISSPIQKHQTQLVNDLFVPRSLAKHGGAARLYQPGWHRCSRSERRLRRPVELHRPTLEPTPQLFINREKVQFLIFTEQESLDLYRKPPRTERVMLYFRCSSFRVRSLS
jgi:hypothetical protein